MQPTLIIGLGGAGAHIVAGTLAKLLEIPSNTEKVGGTFQFLYVDADTHVAENLKLPEHCKQGIGFFALPYIYAPLRRVQAKPTVRRTAVLPDAAR